MERSKNVFCKGREKSGVFNSVKSQIDSGGTCPQLSEKDRTISFENIASTKMAGPKELMTQEMTFFKLLENVTSYRISGPELTLLDGDRTLVVLYLAD